MYVKLHLAINVIYVWNVNFVVASKYKYICVS
jgi:hypothetical protein